jgi:hypothetical protein
MKFFKVISTLPVNTTMASIPSTQAPCRVVGCDPCMSSPCQNGGSIKIFFVQ